jgi:hypothetical protein
VKGPHVYTPTPELVCTQCDFLKHKLLKSGRHPEWECYCTHPKADAHTGGFIGSGPSTPQWCPFRKNVQSDSLIECRECGHRFDVMKAKIDRPILPNTLTGLKSCTDVVVTCPHCSHQQ